MESIIDVCKLRGGDEVPVIKFADEQWSFGNFNSIKKLLAKSVETVAWGTVNSVVQAAISTSTSRLPALQSELEDFDTEKLYGAGVLYTAIVMDAKKNHMDTAVSDCWEGLKQGIKDDADALSLVADPEKKKTAEHIEDEVAMADKIKEIKEGNPGKAVQETVEDSVKDAILELVSPSMSYSDHLNIFMFFLSNDTLVTRTGNLITLNMTNIMQNSNKSDSFEGQLALNKNELFDLSTARTAFDLETGVRLKLLFMSEPLFKSESGGSVGSGFVNFTVENSRGY